MLSLPLSRGGGSGRQRGGRELVHDRHFSICLEAENDGLHLIQFLELRGHVLEQWVVHGGPGRQFNHGAMAKELTTLIDLYVGKHVCDATKGKVCPLMALFGTVDQEYGLKVGQATCDGGLDFRRDHAHEHIVVTELGEGIGAYADWHAGVTGQEVYHRLPRPQKQTCEEDLYRYWAMVPFV